MPLSSFLSKSLRSFLCCLFVLSVFLPQNSYAIYEGVRDMDYDQDSFMCKNDDYKTFDGFMTNSKMSDFDLSNQICQAISTTYVALLLAQWQASKSIFCKAKNVVAFQRGAPAVEEGAEFIGPLMAPIPTPTLLAQYTYMNIACGSFTADVAASACPGAYCYNLPAATADQTSCCWATVVFLASLTALTTAESIVWDKARITYENARVCGHKWNRWRDENDTSTDGDVKDITCVTTDGIYGQTMGPYKLCLRELFTGVPAYKCGSSGATYDCSDILEEDDLAGAAELSIENKFYREYIYGGIEYVDSGEGNCSNPWADDHEKRKQVLGYDSDDQRYFMTGAGSAPVFACQRFLSYGINEDTQKAYDCCKERSQNSMCIENRTGLDKILGDYKYKFCKLGDLCTVADTTFDVYASKEQPNYACAKTYSLCPYNHLLGGGTEEKDSVYSSDSNIGEITKNYCQYMNHCSKLPILPYVYSSNLDGAYISGACRDLKGDSQNNYGYTSQLVPINTRNFSAPMAQCFKETMENVFLNKAGASICLNPSELPDAKGVCANGYKYMKGESLVGESFFAKIQKNLQSAIKVALVISIVAFGYTILMGVPKVDSFNKKALFGYVVKVALVMYFAVGTAWQDQFVDGVLSFSSEMSNLIFKPDESGELNTLDGCQFPRYNYLDDNETTRYDNPAYPPGLEYLRVWDTLDCKMARALGFGPEVSVPNLIFMILGGFLDFGGGILFVVGAMFLAFVLIMITIRSLHIFLIATTAVILLIYVSPITITCAMFNRTKGIFTGWWKQLLGISLQPMILFAYLGVLIAIFDIAVIGDVRFKGDGKQTQKQIICDGAANDTSIYCIFNIADIKTMHGLEALGIGLPSIATLNKTKVMTIFKSALLMFIFLQFLDKISELAVALVGGAGVNSDWAGAGKMAKSVAGALQAIQKRGMGALKKHGKAALRKGGEVAKNAGKALGSSGKSAEDSGGEGGGDRIESSAPPAAAIGDHPVNSNEQGGENAVSSDSLGSDSPSAGGLETIEEGDESEEEDEGGGDEKGGDVAESSAKGGADNALTSNSGGDNVTSSAAAGADNAKSESSKTSSAPPAAAATPSAPPAASEGGGGSSGSSEKASESAGQERDQGPQAAQAEGGEGGEEEGGSEKGGSEKGGSEPESTPKENAGESKGDKGTENNAVAAPQAASGSSSGESGESRSESGGSTSAESSEESTDGESSDEGGGGGSEPEEGDTGSESSEEESSSGGDDSSSVSDDSSTTSTNAETPAAAAAEETKQPEAPPTMAAEAAAPAASQSTASVTSSAAKSNTSSAAKNNPVESRYMPKTPTPIHTNYLKKGEGTGGTIGRNVEVGKAKKPNLNQEAKVDSGNHHAPGKNKPKP